MVADGLDGPRGLAVGPDGALYVAVGLGADPAQRDADPALSASTLGKLVRVDAFAVGDSLLVSELTGFPFPVGGANVYTLDAACNQTAVLGGFTTLTEIAGCHWRLARQCLRLRRPRHWRASRQWHPANPRLSGGAASPSSNESRAA